MPNVRFVAFKGKSFVSKAIRFVTRSKKYSHIGFLDSKNYLIECWPSSTNCFQHWCYSCFADHSPGTKFEIWGLEVNNNQQFLIEKTLETYAKKKTKYNWLGCLGFVFKFFGKRPNRLFCSEGCVTPLVKFLGWNSITPSHVSPQDFVELIEAAGAKLVRRGTT